MRNTTIDFLRGLAIVLMILIHATAYFWDDTVAHTLWDYTHFAVPLFIFCSSYLYFRRKKDEHFSIIYVLKRAKRLLIPYYIFLVFYFAFLIFIRGQSLELEGIAQWVFLQGNRDLDWLVILFLYLMLLLPFIRLIAQRKILFWTFFGLSISASLVFVFINVPFHFRTIMWLTWAIIPLVTYLFVHSDEPHNIAYYALIISFGLFAFFRVLLLEQNQSLVLTDNKYPPNIYYLAFGLFWIFALYIFHQAVQFEKTMIQSFLNFMSKNSYSLYFIHFLYLFLLREWFDIKKIGWIVVFIILTILSVGTQMVLNRVLMSFPRRRES